MSKSLTDPYAGMYDVEWPGTLKGNYDQSSSDEDQFGWAPRFLLRSPTVGKRQAQEDHEDLCYSSEDEWEQGDKYIQREYRKVPGHVQRPLKHYLRLSRDLHLGEEMRPQPEEEDLQREEEDLQREEENLQIEEEDLQIGEENLQREKEGLQKEKEGLQREKEDLQRKERYLQIEERCLQIEEGVLQNLQERIWKRVERLEVRKEQLRMRKEGEKYVHEELGKEAEIVELKEPEKCLEKKHRELRMRKEHIQQESQMGEANKKDVQERHKQPQGELHLNNREREDLTWKQNELYPHLLTSKKPKFWTCCQCKSRNLYALPPRDSHCPGCLDHRLCSDCQPVYSEPRINDPYILSPSSILTPALLPPEGIPASSSAEVEKDADDYVMNALIRTSADCENQLTEDNELRRPQEAKPYASQLACHECQTPFEVGVSNCPNCAHKICDTCMKGSVIDVSPQLPHDDEPKPKSKIDAAAGAQGKASPGPQTERVAETQDRGLRADEAQLAARPSFHGAPAPTGHPESDQEVGEPEARGSDHDQAEKIESEQPPETQSDEALSNEAQGQTEGHARPESHSDPSIPPETSDDLSNNNAQSVDTESASDPDSEDSSGFGFVKVPSTLKRDEAPAPSTAQSVLPPEPFTPESETDTQARGVDLRASSVPTEATATSEPLISTSETRVDVPETSESENPLFKVLKLAVTRYIAWTVYAIVALLQRRAGSTEQRQRISDLCAVLSFAAMSFDLLWHPPPVVLFILPTLIFWAVTRVCVRSEPGAVFLLEVCLTYTLMMGVAIWLRRHGAGLFAGEGAALNRRRLLVTLSTLIGPVLIKQQIKTELVRLSDVIGFVAICCGLAEGILYWQSRARSDASASKRQITAENIAEGGRMLRAQVLPEDWVRFLATAAQHLKKSLDLPTAASKRLLRLMLEPGLKPDHVRIRFTCACGARIWDNYPVALGKEAHLLEQRLERFFRQLESGSNPFGKLGSLRSSIFRLSNDLVYTAKSLKRFVFQETRESRTDTETQPDPDRQTDSEEGPHYLTCCPQPGDRRPLLIQTRGADIQGDRDYFDMLRRQASRVQRHWTAFSAPRKIKSIQYVQLHLLHDNQHVDVFHSLEPQFPKIEDEYSPVFSQVDPSETLYLGSNTLLHYFEKEHDCCQHPHAIYSIPKKLKGKLLVPEQGRPMVGWGMALVDGVDRWKVSVHGFIGLLICALLAFLWFMLHNDDIQGAISLASCLMMYILYVVTLRVES